jgi:hypothetical protein
MNLGLWWNHAQLGESKMPVGPLSSIEECERHKANTLEQISQTLGRILAELQQIRLAQQNIAAKTH